MVSTFTDNKHIEQPAHNDYVDTWDVPVNADWAQIDKAFGNSTLLNATGLSGDTTLSIANYVSLSLIVSGAPAAGITYVVPTGVGGQWVFVNNTTGGFHVGIKSNAGGATINVPAGESTLVSCDGSASGMRYSVTTAPVMPVGVVMAYAAATAPVGWLLCNGQAVSRATYDDLFALIGTTYGNGNGTTTFNVPDLRGRVPAGQDAMNASAAGRLTNTTMTPDGDTLGATGGTQTHVLTTAQLASHSHGVVDPQHSHVLPLIDAHLGGTGVGNVAQHSSNVLVSFPSPTGITIQNTGSGQAHLNVQPTQVFSYIIKT